MVKFDQILFNNMNSKKHIEKAIKNIEEDREIIIAFGSIPPQPEPTESNIFSILEKFFITALKTPLASTPG